jgi:hypothetical protein
LRDFFYAGGEGLPLENLQNQKYRDIVSIRLYYDWDTCVFILRCGTYLADTVVSGRDMLMEECVRAMQQTLRASPSIKKRAKSVYSQRNLGTIKDRKREKKEEKEVGGGETIMRILRMRYVPSTQKLGFSFCAYAEAAVQTEHVRLYRATTADPGDDAGRAGAARAPAAEAEGPEARWRSPHPRHTTCTRNTSLTFGVEYCTCHLSGDNTALSSPWIPCIRSIPLSMLCSLLFVFIY